MIHQYTDQSGPIQFKFNRTQNLPLKTSAVSNDIGMNEEETIPLMHSTKKKRLYKPNDPSTSPHSSSSADENEKKFSTKKQKKSESMLHIVSSFIRIIKLRIFFQ
jgi:hypothetical protein